VTCTLLEQTSEDVQECIQQFLDLTDNEVLCLTWLLVIVIPFKVVLFQVYSMSPEFLILLKQIILNNV
jgi:hypothetical protein